MNNLAANNNELNVLVVGGGAAGLAVGACLCRKGIPFLIVEKENDIGYSWLKRYDRLQLHTTRDYSSLPFFAFPRSYPVYPSKNEVAEYLKTYSLIVGKENFLFQHEATKAVWDQANKVWNIEVASPKKETKYFRVKHLVVCTGQSVTPKIPTFEGQEQFKGSVIHSSQYKNGEVYRGNKVLIVGYGNSGGEISLDLWQHSAKPVVTIRNSLNILPRWVARIFQDFIDKYFWMTPLPVFLRRKVARIITKYLYGDLAKYGIVVPKDKSPYDQHKETHDPPMTDIGQIDLVRKGEVKVITSEIARFTKNGAIFKDGHEESFDHVILATGFHKIGSLLSFMNDKNIIRNVTNSNGVIKSAIEDGKYYNIYFNGFTDDLSAMRSDAFIIADHISNYKEQYDKNKND